MGNPYFINLYYHSLGQHLGKKQKEFRCVVLVYWLWEWNKILWNHDRTQIVFHWFIPITVQPKTLTYVQSIGQKPCCMFNAWFMSFDMWSVLLDSVSSFHTLNISLNSFLCWTVVESVFCQGFKMREHFQNLRDIKVYEVYLKHQHS